MKLLSEYLSEDGKKTAKVFYETKERYVVITKDEMGCHYTTNFISMRLAENFAEDWVL